MRIGFHCYTIFRSPSFIVDGKTAKALHVEEWNVQTGFNGAHSIRFKICNTFPICFKYTMRERYGKNFLEKWLFEIPYIFIPINYIFLARYLLSSDAMGWRFERWFPSFASLNSWVSVLIYLFPVQSWKQVRNFEVVSCTTSAVDSPLKVSRKPMALLTELLMNVIVLCSKSVENNFMRPSIRSLYNELESTELMTIRLLVEKCSSESNKKVHRMAVSPKLIQNILLM